MSNPMLRRLPVTLTPDASRTVIRPFLPNDPPAFAVEGRPRAKRIVRRVLALAESEVAEATETTIEPLRERHRHTDETLLRRYEEIRKLRFCGEVSRDRALLIGAYFSEEYSFEAAALFNPSIVPHPDQSGLSSDTVRFILSLRGIGEGHVSSVTFRTGTWQAGGELSIDPPSGQGVPPRISTGPAEPDGTATLTFATRELSEAVLFPVLPSQAKGIEDLRLVRFTADDGTCSYLGTYTAFDGQQIRQQLLQANADLSHVRLCSLEGPHMDSKGMALFPRRVGGSYTAVGRPDSENVWLRYSDDLISWREGPKLLGPKAPWEFVQIGNCGPPIEIAEGWLLLTHGVGMVRTYSIGAVLLDKADPSKVLARTRLPLLQPNAEVKGGYVPNVVYSCGALVHDRVLLLPHGVADQFTAFATAPVAEILNSMI